MQNRNFIIIRTNILPYIDNPYIGKTPSVDMSKTHRKGNFSVIIFN